VLLSFRFLLFSPLSFLFLSVAKITDAAGTSIRPLAAGVGLMPWPLATPSSAFIAPACPTWQLPRIQCRLSLPQQVALKLRDVAICVLLGSGLHLSFRLLPLLPPLLPAALVGLSCLAHHI
jgi:hypothetical protein